MKIAIINFSGNVGKTTLARHLLAPRIPGAEIVSIESANADALESDALRGRDFSYLQQFMLAKDNLIVDIGASNVEDLMDFMRQYQDSHDDFDYFLVPAVPDTKQQKDSANTANELVRLGVPPAKIKIVFNRSDSGRTLEREFTNLLSFLSSHPVATFSTGARLSENEIYQRALTDGRSITDLAADTTDYKALIAKAKSYDAKIQLADKLAVKRLATGVLPELDACFTALDLR